MFVFFFNVSATTEIYTYWHTLSLHDALPISVTLGFSAYGVAQAGMSAVTAAGLGDPTSPEERVVALQAELAEVKTAAKARSEEHTSELQSLMRISYAVFCLKKKKKNKIHMIR